MFKKSEFTKSQYTTGDIAKILNLTPRSIIRQDSEGLLPFQRTPTNRRVMFREDLLALLESKNLLFDDELNNKRDVIYCRVSRHEQKQKGDLD